MCYAVFPVTVFIGLNDLAFDAPAKEKLRIFDCTMLWLERYGWITIELRPKGVPGATCHHVQLTEKALCALNWLPETLRESDRPLGQRIMEALASNAPASAVGALVGEAVKAFVRHGV